MFEVVPEFILMREAMTHALYSLGHDGSLVSGQSSFLMTILPLRSPRPVFFTVYSWLRPEMDMTSDALARVLRAME